MPSYSRTSRILHWLTALLVVGLIIVGISLDKMPDGALKDAAFDGHRATGIVVMLLTLWRLADRTAHPPGPYRPPLPALQRLAAGIVHFSIYALLIVNPLVGLVGSWIYGAPLNVFWLFSVPSPFATNVKLAENILGCHSLLGWALAALLAIHIGAALFHHFILKDNVVRRMTGSA